jgi:hypothetical protein
MAIPLDPKISVTDIVLTITAVAVFWYAWETRRLRFEQAAPFISLYFRKYDLSKGIDRVMFQIKNDGKGAAINIQVLAPKDISGKTPIFQKIGVLPPGLEEMLTIKKVHYEEDNGYKEGLVAQSDFLAHFRALVGLYEFPFELQYKDIFKRSYTFKGIFEETIPGTWVFRRECK